ncbi:MAG: hypothetical protein ACE3JN_11410 [Ectobacillus sp.]
MLAALSLLLMVAALFVPQAVLLIQERKDTYASHMANAVLKEEIARYLYNPASSFTSRRNISSISFFIEWRDTNIQHQKQICVSWNNAKKQLENRCYYVAK